jgi:hypothetical protein
MEKVQVKVQMEKVLQVKVQMEKVLQVKAERDVEERLN